MSNALAVVNNEMSITETMQLGKVLADSGFFSDSRGAAQAIVKILAGRELGFGPVASMTGVNVIKGKVSLSANLIAASIKRSGRYNYRVAALTDEACTIHFYEGAEQIGTSTFTMADAKAAGLTGDNWRKFSRNMLFARAISNGAKWYCPDLSGGPLYTPDELGAEIDGETGEVIGEVVEGETTFDDLPPAPRQAAPKVEPKPKPQRPYDPATLRAGIAKQAIKSSGVASDKQRIAARLAVMALVLDDEPQYRTVLAELFGKDSSAELTAGQCSALIKWAGTADNEDHQPNPDAIQECAALIRQAQIDAGQASLI